MNYEPLDIPKAQRRLTLVQGLDQGEAIFFLRGPHYYTKILKGPECGTTTDLSLILHYLIYI